MLGWPQVAFALIGGFLCRRFKSHHHSPLIRYIRGLFQISDLLVIMPLMLSEFISQPRRRLEPAKSDPKEREEPPEASASRFAL